MFQLVAKPSGPGASLEVPVEVILGTIPLRKTEQGTPQLTVKAALQHVKGGDALPDPATLVKGQRPSPRPSPQMPRAAPAPAPAPAAGAGPAGTRVSVGGGGGGGVIRVTAPLATTK